ncbi:unnamed protein product [Nippostrongylus brasiliensis]|uniref:Uncharacterized protein n=1 Tax=Nippostrongylus brasiliensis TaxID=27835 RepID=A0A0N4XCT6_NIPBR|nr:unnamed protein product [Nippostrongylus brasiliensis]
MNMRPVLVPKLTHMTAAEPFDLVCVDPLEMCPNVSRMKYVLVLVVHFSKWLGAYSLPDKSAATVASDLPAMDL